MARLTETSLLGDRERRFSAVYAVLICAVLLGLGFLTFFGSLDRYPGFYVDEAFYNYPAISFLHGEGFRYKLSAEAPYGDQFWAYNGPFYSRLQVATFSLFGETLAASRAPQYLFGHLSVAVLCCFLIRNGLSFPAVLVAICWCGDRATQEILYGRPDGIALFFLMLGFISLTEALRRPTLAWGCACGLSLGTAVGFHVIAANFVIGTGCVLLLMLQGRKRWCVLAGYIAGGAVPLVMILACWRANIPGALEQFLWHTGFLRENKYFANAFEMFAVLNWSRYWVALLMFGVATLFIPAAVSVCWSRYSLEKVADNRFSIWFTACVFSVIGLWCLAAPQGLFPYYVIYFSIWPITAFAILLSEKRSSIGGRLAISLFATVLLAAWIPSFAWNGLRFRESLKFHAAMDHSQLLQQLRQAIPAGEPVAPIPELVIVACEARLRVSPLPWAPEQTLPPENCYLLINRQEFESPRYLDQRAFAGRAICFAGSAFPDAGPLDYNIVILGPVRHCVSLREDVSVSAATGSGFSGAGVD